MSDVGDAYPIEHNDRRFADEGHPFDEKLRTSESRFAAAVAAVGVLWTNDASGQMSGDQPGWASLTGQSFADYQGYGWAAAVHPDDAQPTIDAWNLAVAERRPFIFEHRVLTRDGEYAYFAIRAVPVMDAGGAIVEWVGVHRDITHQRLAEEALRDFNTDLERLVAQRTVERDRAWDQSLDLQHVITPDGIIRAANRAWTRVLGWENDEIVGEHHLKFHFEEDFEANEIALATATDDPLAGFETRMRHKDGSAHWVNWVANPQGDKIYANGRDVTERRAAEEQLRQAQKMEAIGQLTGGVAHDFNNLLTVISGGLQMLERSQDPARTQRLMDGMRQAVERGAGLTRQLLAFSRRQSLRPEPIALAPMVEKMRDLLDRSLRGDIRVETGFPDGLWPVEADPSELQLALLNLCVNARDAMPIGGRIRIRAANRPGEDGAADAVDLMVCDEGTGIATEIAARVFEPFFTTKEIGHGSGLGLAQVHGFATQSGGAVAVDSVPGQGANFTITLPRSSGTPAIAGQDPRLHEQRGSGRVLLIEDDAQVAMLVSDMIRELGYEVDHLADAATALERIGAAEGVDVILSDVMMPGGVSGIDLFNALRSRGIEVPFVLASGRADAVADDAASVGVELLAKPFTIADVAGALARALG